MTLGCFGVDNCIKFDIVASLGPEEEQPPSGWRFAQLEVDCVLDNLGDNDFDDDHDHDHDHDDNDDDDDDDDYDDDCFRLSIHFENDWSQRDLQ